MFGMVFGWTSSNQCELQRCLCIFQLTRIPGRSCHTLQSWIHPDDMFIIAWLRCTACRHTINMSMPQSSQYKTPLRTLSSRPWHDEAWPPTRHASSSSSSSSPWPSPQLTIRFRLSRIVLDFEANVNWIWFSTHSDTLDCAVNGMTDGKKCLCSSVWEA